MTVALLGLKDFAGARHGYLLGGSLLGIVVDDQHLVDDAGSVEALDHLPDRVSLGVGHEHH